MSNPKQQAKNKRRLRMMREVFDEYIIANGDTMASGFVPTILREAALASGLRSSNDYAHNARFRTEEAYEAARLLDRMLKFNPSNDDPAVHVWRYPFIETRSKLWDKVLQALHLEQEEDAIQRHLSALLAQGPLGEKGEEKFQELCSKRTFDSCRANLMIRSFRPLKDVAHNTHVMRCLLRGVINGLDDNDFNGLIVQALA